MESFKIEQFEQENGVGSFPHFKSLTAEECEQVRRRIALSLGLEPNVDSKILLEKIFSLRINRMVNFVNGALDLASELASISVDAESLVFINWYRFDDIDQIKLGDLSIHFNDIWHPIADDIEIFDSTLSWVASISHYSVFRLFYLDGQES